MTLPRNYHPSIPALAFIIWWVVASVVFPDRMLNADGDMLRHIGHGNWMLEHGRLITEDPFSYTRAGQPFTAFEYGSQLALAVVHNVAGLAGVAIFAGLLIAAAYALLARFLLARGVDALLAYLASVAAALLGAVHWSARPHLFSLLGVMLVWHVIEQGSVEPVRSPPNYGRALAAGWSRYAATGLLFAIWANFHGGFIFGLAMIAIYCAGSMAEMTGARNRASDEWRAKALDYLGLGTIATIGTFFTPHGWKLHRHIIEFFSAESQFLLDNTNEFLSPNFHSFTGKLLLAAILGTVTIIALNRQRIDLRRLFLILAMIYFALDARRNIQLFGAVVFPALALQYNDSWRSLGFGYRIRAVFERDSKTGRTAPYIALMLIVFSIVASHRGRIASSQLVPNVLSSTSFPIRVVEQARHQHWEGRLFHDFVWGGFLVFAWPEQKVFIDGGTDFYGAELMRTYGQITALRPHWRDSLASWKIDRVLLPTRSRLAHELLREPGWKIVACDPTAVFATLDNAQVGALQQPGVEVEERLLACAATPVE